MACSSLGRSASQPSINVPHPQSHMHRARSSPLLCLSLRAPSEQVTSRDCAGLVTVTAPKHLEDSCSAGAGARTWAALWTQLRAWTTSGKLLGSRVPPNRRPSAAVRREYAVMGRIGRGSCSDVWLCENKRTGNLHACKVVPKGGRPPQALTSPGCVQREADVMKRLSLLGHESVVRLLGVRETQKRVELLMEYCDTGDLFTLVKRSGALGEGGARTLFAQLASALACLHEHGVTHRDVRLENILLCSDCCRGGIRAKLGGFRLAIVAVGKDQILLHNDKDQLFHNDKDQLLLQDGIEPTCWSAPEVHAGRGHGAKADVYGLGLVLYCVLTGKLPQRETEQSEDNGSGCCDAMSVDLTTVKSELARDLLRGMLEPGADRRLCSNQVLAHPWLVESSAGVLIPPIGALGRGLSLDHWATQKSFSCHSSPVVMVPESCQVNVMSKSSSLHLLGHKGDLRMASKWLASIP